MSKGKKILRFFGVLVVAAGFVGVLMLTSFNSKNQNDSICDELLININHDENIFFLDETDIKTILTEQLGDSIRGDKLSEIPVGSIEKIIERNPFVDDAEIFLDANGGLHLEIVQKQPLARVINRYGVNYYISDKGNKIPISGKFTSRVPVITGEIEEGTKNQDTIETQTLQSVLELARFIHNSSFWNAQIEQIAISTDKEITLVPKMGDHLIQFGKIENIETKFSNLELFYKNGLNYTGWEKYKIISVQFDGQVVCKKIQAYEQ